MKEHLLLMLSQSLIGTGFFFLYVNHVRSIFESRTNIADLAQLERESLLRREDALYYSFYKTLTEENDFWSGYEKLKNVTAIEYPHSVNVLQRFHVLPELTIAYIYHTLRGYSNIVQFPLLGCWRSNDPHLPFEHRRCDSLGQPMQFYLEIVWLLGGLTILVIYVYGTLLSENISGGIYAVVSYIMFHSYASKVYDRPVARENFAFPIIFLQMFYLCLCMDRVIERKQHGFRIFMTIKLTILTTIALLCWQFSSIIFTTQILIITAAWNFNPIPNYVLNSFTLDYAISQVLGNLLAYYISFGNKKFIFAWQVGPALGLILISIVRRTKPDNQNNDYSMKTIAMGILMATTAQGSLLDFLEKLGVTRSVDNSFALYRDLIVHWSLQAKVNFSTSLAACNPDYKSMRISDLWELMKTLIIKPYCMYGVVMLAKFFRKWRKSSDKKPPTEENIERAKKYVLEDFLEENHISMKDMSNVETERELNECLKLLESCDYNYERYKIEKSKIKEDKADEHLEFINDIKKLKEQINEINEKKNKEKLISNRSGDDLPITSTTNKAPEKEETQPTKASAAETKSKPSRNETKANEVNGNRRTRSSKINSKRTPVSGAHSTPVSAASSAESTTAKAIRAEMDIFSFHYVYSFMQMGIFLVIGLSVKKLFFLSFTLGCVIAPTICSKFWFRKQRNLFWTVSLAVFMTSLFDPGMVNIREEYFPKHTKYGNDDLDTMCEWIKMNTEKDAVFAGPIDIIGTVHLTTKRPIVNHAHLEMRQISDRTEHVYSIFSRQQSSDIYNQYSQLKIQYLIISFHDCSNTINDECDLLSIWDDMQPVYRKYPQFCSELITKNVPSFLKVFSNDYYGIIKMFSQSVQINLKHSKMPEKMM